MDDISNPMDGYTHPAEEHVHDLIDFVQRWDRRAPIVMHCYAGISRSTAGAFISACALNPDRDEATIAQAIRAILENGRAQHHAGRPSPTAFSAAGPHDRRGRGAGPGLPSLEGHPFRLDLE